MKIVTHVKLLFMLPLVILFASACAVVPPEKRIPYPEGKIIPGVPSDEDLFLIGTSYLGNSEIIPDYFNAKAAFEKLVKTYPDSKWRNASVRLIALINEVQILKQKKPVAADALRLMQENEQLKKDIEHLKRLEIESEKRAKTLR